MIKVNSSGKVQKSKLAWKNWRKRQNLSCAKRSISVYWSVSKVHKIYAEHPALDKRRQPLVAASTRPVQRVKRSTNKATAVERRALQWKSLIGHTPASKPEVDPEEGVFRVIFYEHAIGLATTVCADEVVAVHKAWHFHKLWFGLVMHLYGDAPGLRGPGHFVNALAQMPLERWWNWTDWKDVLTADERCEALDLFRRKSYVIPRLQAGETREEREVQQRSAAKRRERLAFKEKHTKEQRERIIRDARDKRNPAVPELQSGALVNVVKGLVVAFTGLVASKVVRAGHKAAGIAAAFIKDMSDIMASLKASLKDAAFKVVLIVVLYYCLHRIPGVGECGAAIASLIIVHFCGRNMWDNIKALFTHDVAVPTLQSGEDNAMAKLLAGALCVSIFKRGVNHFTAGEFLKRIGNFDRAAAGLDSFARWLITTIVRLCGWVRARFSKEAVRKRADGRTAMLCWLEAVDAARSAHSTASVDVEPAELDKLVKLVVEGHQFKSLYRGSPYERGVNEALVQVTGILQPYLGAFNARNNFRFEPVCTMLRGKPGTGKTLCTQYICGTALKLSGVLGDNPNATDIMNNIWQKGNSEYWNSYSGQACVILDDAFQQRTTANDKDSEYMSIIRMVSSWSMPLNFADLASKGKIFFSSKLVFGTTNASSLRSSAGIVIAEPEAVVRRIGFPYTIEVNSEYALPDGKLDYPKYLEELRKCQTQSGIKAFPWYIWRAYKHDFLSGQTSYDTARTLEDVVREIAEALKTRLSAFGESRTAMFSYLDQLTPELQSGGDESDDYYSTNDYHSPSAEISPVAEADETVRKILEMTDEEWHKRVDDLEDQDRVRIIKELKNFLFTARYARQLEAPDPFTPQCGYSENDEAEDLDEVYIRKVWHRLPPKRKSWIELCTRADQPIGKITRLGWAIIGTGVAAMVVLGLLKTVVKAVMHFFKGVVGLVLPRKKPKPQSNTPVVMQPPTYVGDAIIDNVYYNTYKVEVFNEFKRNELGQVIFICSETAMFPLHFMEAIENMGPDAVVRLRSAGNSMHLDFKAAEFLKFRTSVDSAAELAFVNFKSIRAHRNILSTLLTERDLLTVPNRAVRLDVLKFGTRGPMRHANGTSRVFLGRQQPMGKTCIDRHFRYEIATEAGDCGAPLCLADHALYGGRALMGFHVAGLPGYGYANVVTREMVEKHLNELKTVRDNFRTDLAERIAAFQKGPIRDIHDGPFPDMGSFQPLVEVEKGPVLCPKTAYYRIDEIYGAFGEYLYKPAPLSRVQRGGEWIHPMVNAVRPYSSPVMHYSQDWLEQAVHVALTPFAKETTYVNRREFTFDEAVVGIPELKFRSIPRNTAAGYPYVLSHKDGKKDFFGHGAEYDLSGTNCHELRKRVDHVLSEARRGVRLSHVFVDFLKDELRSPEKVEAVATRLISSAPLDYVVAWRMLFGAFSAAAMSNHTRVAMAPGICCYTDWHMLVECMERHDGGCFDGDFKGFDSSEQPVIHDLVLQYINAWYGDSEENQLARKVLWYELTHSRHIGGLGNDQRFIYQWNKSLPSGHPFTTIINSIYSLTLLVGTYISNTGDLTGFWNHVSPVTYGDDNIVNVSSKKREQYNQRTVAEAMMREFGIVYTSGRKDGQLAVTFPKEQLTFLKRAIRIEKGFCMAPLELDSFLYTAYWGKNRKLERTIIVDVLENALCELSMHEPSQWDRYAGRIGKVLEGMGEITKAPLNRDAYLRLVRARSDHWY